MKITETTLTILKNFVDINKSLLINKGNMLRTISVDETIYAEAIIPEEFPKEFAIYELKKFLDVLCTLYKVPELDFSNDSFVLIKEDKLKSKYFFADKNMISATPPSNKIAKLPSEDVSFHLEHSIIDKFMKAKVIYRMNDLSVVGDSKEIRLVLRDKKNSLSDEYSVYLGKTDKDFSLNFSMENLKIIPGAYDVCISSKLKARFFNQKYNIKYYVPLEPDSKYQ